MCLDIDQIFRFFECRLLRTRSAQKKTCSAITDPAAVRNLTAFFAWSAWCAAALRPGHDYSYTNNWPPEPLVSNGPTADNVVWSVLSLIAWLGGATEHYRADLSSFFGIDLSRLLPFNIARTWHLQLAIFWVATGFLAAGIFLAPIIAGRRGFHCRRGAAAAVFILAEHPLPGAGNDLGGAEGGAVYRSCGADRGALSVETIDIEVLLATGYAVLLVAVAFGLELVARNAHRHSEQWRVAGFQYRPEHDLWECPAGERLERVSFDHGSVVARYRAPARACNACALKPLCTGKIRPARPGAAQKVVATRLVGLTFKVKNFLLNETNHEWLGP